MMLSPAMNTAATVSGYTDTSGDDAGRDGPRRRPTVRRRRLRRQGSGVGDQLHPVAVPAELHHAGQTDSAGVTQGHRVAGALRVVDPVEAVGVGDPLRR